MSDGEMTKKPGFPLPGKKDKGIGKQTLLCSVWGIRIPVLSSFISCRNKSTMSGVNSEARNWLSFWVHPCFSGVTVTRSLVFWVVFMSNNVCIFCLFFLAFVLCVLIRITVYDYLYVILKLYFPLILMYYNDYSFIGW